MEWKDFLGEQQNRSHLYLVLYNSVETYSTMRWNINQAMTA